MHRLHARRRATRACLVNLDSGLNISTLLTIWNAPCLLFSTGFWPARRAAHMSQARQPQGNSAACWTFTHGGACRAYSTAVQHACASLQHDIFCQSFVHETYAIATETRTRGRTLLQQPSTDAAATLCSLQNWHTG